MILTTQLRIGNLISFKGLWDGEVSGVRGEVIYIKDNNGIFTSDGFNPIPLTPEWLERVGFNKHDNSNEFFTFWNLPNNWHIAESHHTEPSAGVEKGGFYWGEDYKEVKYLHQLQNLFFSLCGTELVVK